MSQNFAENVGIAQAIREIYDKLDDLLLSDNFDRCNEILRSVDPHHVSLKLLLGYLTITLPWKQNLVERGLLAQRIRQMALEQFPKERVDRLLKGLE